WSPVVLRNMLLSARISGRREHHRVITADATWPAIITPVQSDGLRRLLRDTSRRTAWTSRSYLLREVIGCGLCGKRLRARPTATGRRCYVCVSGPPNQGCGRIKIDAQYIEDDVVARIMHAVDSPEFARALAASEDDVATPALAAVEAITSERDTRAAMLASGELTVEEWRIMSPILNDRLSAAQHQYDALRGRDALHRIPRPLASAWERFDDAQRRETVRHLVATVTVHAAKRGRNVYDPERVYTAWRV
ncbi:MAG: zinc ribbon domain-containing protein, partial [Acidimicrobiales bacterium]